MPLASLHRLLAAAAVGVVSALVLAPAAFGVTAPASTTPPVIPAPRAYLANTATTGTWSGDTPTVTQQWQVSSSPDPGGTWSSATGTGATTLTYTPVQSDAGKYLRLKETATNGAGSADAYSAVQYVTRPDVLFTRNSGSTGTDGFTAFPILPATSEMLAGIAAGNAGDTSSQRPPVAAPTGQYVFSGTNSGGINRLPVNPDGTFGAPTSAATCGSGTVFRGVITADHRYAYFLDRGSNAVCQYAYDAGLATLTALSPASVSVGCGNLNNVVLNPAQTALYVSCRDGGVAGFSVGAGGLLTAMPGSPFETGTKPTYLAITPDGKNLYGTQYDSGQWVRTYSVNQVTGVPTLDAANSFSFSGPDGVTAFSDTIVYVASYDAGTITRYSRDPATGALSGASAVTTGTNGGPSPPSASMLVSPDNEVLYFGGSGGSNAMGQMGIGAGGALSPLTPYVRSASSSYPLEYAYSKPTPHVAEFSTPATSITSPAVSSLTYTLNLGEPSTGITADDFTIGGTSAGWSVQSVTGQGAGPYTVTLAGGTTDGTVALSIKADVATGVNGITGPAGVVPAPVVTLNRPPMAAWTTVPSSPVPYASSSPLSYVVTFNKSVTGVDSSVFINSGTATGCTISTPTTAAQSVTTAFVSVTGCSPGTVVPTLAQNSLTDASSATGPASADAAPAVTISAPLPTVASWSSVPSSRIPFEDSSPLTYVVSFADAVTGVTAADFSNLGTSAGCLFEVDAPPSQAVTSVTVTVTGCAPGSVIVRMAADAATGPFGVAAPATALTAPTVTVQPQSAGGAPAPAISIGPARVSAAGVASVPVTCAGPAGATCAITTSLLVDGATVVTTSGSGPVDAAQWARMQLPASLQRRLSLTGRLVATVHVVAVMNGATVVRDQQVILRAPQGARAVDLRARLAAGGSAVRVRARCVGTLPARCNGTWRLRYVAAVNWATPDAVAVAGRTRFVAPSGRTAGGIVPLDANGRAMVAKCRVILVRVELRVGSVVSRGPVFRMGNPAGCEGAAVTG